MYAAGQNIRCIYNTCVGFPENDLAQYKFNILLIRNNVYQYHVLERRCKLTAPGTAIKKFYRVLSRWNIPISKDDLRLRPREIGKRCKTPGIVRGEDDHEMVS